MLKNGKIVPNGAYQSQLTLLQVRNLIHTLTNNLCYGIPMCSLLFQVIHRSLGLKSVV